MRFIESGVTNMANEKRLIDHKEYARQMRTHAVADAGVIRVSTELWEQIADVIENSVEVVHGRWEDGICTMCGYPIPTDSKCDFIDEDDCLFCYHCGAKMNGGNEDV